MQQQIVQLSVELGNRLNQLGWKLTVAESCTGGGICYALTEVPGCSAWLDRGFVTYSNLSKQALLGVNIDTLERYGAVSAEVVCEMVAGALACSIADVAIAVTGIAGPGGATQDKTVGTVFIGWSTVGSVPHWQQFHFSGSRSEIRLQTIQEAIAGCQRTLES